MWSYMIVQLSIRSNFVEIFSYNKKTNEYKFDYEMVLSAQDFLYLHPIMHECYYEKSGVYACIQTISNRFYVKMGDSPKYIPLDSNEVNSIDKL